MNNQNDGELITVGIDPHKKWAVARFFNVTTNEKWTFRFEVTKPTIRKFAKEFLRRDMLVGIEDGPNAYTIASLLKEHVDRLFIVCPEKHRSSVKTDDSDAERIAIALATNTYKGRWIPPLALENLRQQIHHRHKYARIVASLKNSISSFLARELIQLEAKDPFSKKGIEEMKKIAKTSLPKDKGFILFRDVAAFEVFSLLLKLTDAYLRFIAKDNPLVQILISMPGIDAIAALYLIAEIGNPARFPSPKKLAKYAGLVPSLYQSGERSRNGRITKAGRKLIRWIMVQIALNAVRFPSHIREFFLRIRAKKGFGVAIVATARKLLCTVWHMLTKNEVYRDCVSRLYQKKVRALARSKDVDFSEMSHLEKVIEELEEFVRERGIELEDEEGLVSGLINAIMEWEVLVPKNLYP
jgi:transposase